MGIGGVDLPSGYRLNFHETIDSTNEEALRLAGRGEEGGLWIWGARQDAGRGRAGRGWTSPPGNLHASLLLRPRVPLATALQLSLLAGVAAFDAIGALAAGAGAAPALRLKWPNDILLGDAKLGGILLESRSGAEADAPAIVIGTGLNLVQAPGDLGRPVASLADAGIQVEPHQAFAALAWSTAEWIAQWRDGSSFNLIRAAWLDRAKPLGGPISVRLGDDLVSGTFLGIDEVGALRLATEAGERRITAGDVSIGAEAQRH
jgi:BirA family transcriptional regulator, biotin operon repressor / biotin---[acetyl-CoA-carboxylase] ligase